MLYPALSPQEVYYLSCVFLPSVVSMLIRALCTASRSVKLRLYLVIVARCQLDITSLVSPETRLLRRLFDYKPDYKAAVALLLDMSRLY